MADTIPSAGTKEHHRFTVGEEPVTSVLQGGDVPINTSGHEWDADEEVLAALG